MRLLRERLHSLMDLVGNWGNGGDDFDLGVKAFDWLARNQKLALLLEAGQALEDEVVPIPELMAGYEATVATAFFKIGEETSMKIEEEEKGVRFRDDPLC